VQVPWELVKLQAIHASAHLLLQQTPWAHSPEAQSVPALQLAPSGLRPQLPFTQ
jgi:hypothetical protein